MNKLLLALLLLIACYQVSAQYTCFNLASTSPYVCSGNGKYCDTVVGCYGVAYSDPLVCSGSGTCNITIGTCACNTGSFGVDCRYKQCYGKIYPSACGGRGDCTSAGTCSCYPGWIGTECDTPACNKVAYNNVNTCSGKGTCISPDLCSCKIGYCGPWCNWSTNCTSNSTAIILPGMGNEKPWITISSIAIPLLIIIPIILLAGCLAASVFVCQEDTRRPN